MNGRQAVSVAVALVSLSLSPVASAQSPSPTPAGLTQSAVGAVYAPAPPSPSPSPVPLAPIGADPPLREPVVAVEPLERLDPTRPATIQRKRDGVLFEVWLPRRALSPGEWLAAHIRITNQGRSPISLRCSPTSLALHIHELFDPGDEWTGNAATLKRMLLDQTWLGSNMLRNGRASCREGKIGAVRLRRGQQLEYDARVLPRYVVHDQPLPAGRVPLTATLAYSRSPGGREGKLTVHGEVELDGPPWLWATPQQVVDAALADPPFSAWLAERGPACCFYVPSLEAVDAPGSIYWSAHGFAGPAPDGTVVIEMFPSSLLLDPWTAQVISFDEGS